MKPRQPDFADVYDEHVWQVYAFFAYRVRNRPAAEDLTQVVFERALRAWSRYDPARAAVNTWLMGIARNLLIDHYRADRGDTERPIGEGEDWVGATGVGDVGLSPELEVALGELGDREREIVALRFGGDLSGKEIAELTGLSLANVQQILSRSLRRLRSSLEDQAASGPRPPALDAPVSNRTRPETP